MQLGLAFFPRTCLTVLQPDGPTPFTNPTRPHMDGLHEMQHNGMPTAAGPESLPHQPAEILKEGRKRDGSTFCISRHGLMLIDHSSNEDLRVFGTVLCVEE